MVPMAFGLVTQPRMAVPQPVAEPPVTEGSVTLRVSGGKPLRLAAHLLAEGTSWSPRAEAWHEVALYRRDTGEFAVALKTFKKAQGEADVYRAELFPNFEELVLWLEGFDPTADLTVDLDASDRRVSAAEIAMRAAALRQRADEITRQYHALIGEVLFSLDAGG